MRLLVTLDRSERDRIALRQSARMVKATNGCIMLIHVIPRTRSLVPGAIREAEGYLHAVQKAIEIEDGLSSEGMVLKGDPATEIIRIARLHQVDCVILVTRGRRGWDKMVLGSVAESVLAHCEAPLLLLNEATNQARLGQDAKRQATYLAGVIWSKQARGLYDEDDANNELERLIGEGLDRDVLMGTYSALAKDGSPADLLDFEFQVKTLRRYLPGEIEALDRTSDAA